MTVDQFISVREAGQILGTSEKKIMDLVEEGKLKAYKIADQFLRLKKTEVMGIKQTGTVTQENVAYAYTPAERIQDFFYFNDFYLVATFIIMGLLYLILYI